MRQEKQSSYRHDTYCIVLHTPSHMHTLPLSLCESLHFLAIISFLSAGRWLLTTDSASSFQMDCF